MRPFGPTAIPNVRDANAMLLYAVESSATHVAPPSVERSMPLNPAATSMRPFVAGTNATAERYPCGDVTLSANVHVAPPSEVVAKLRPRNMRC